MQGSICCGYGSLGVMSSGYDCVMIPGATKAADKAPVPNSICGQGKGLVTTVLGMTTATVCSKYSQFVWADKRIFWQKLEAISSERLFLGFLWSIFKGYYFLVS